MTIADIITADRKKLINKNTLRNPNLYKAKSSNQFNTFVTSNPSQKIWDTWIAMLTRIENEWLATHPLGNWINPQKNQWRVWHSTHIYGFFGKWYKMKLTKSKRNEYTYTVDTTETPKRGVPLIPNTIAHQKIIVKNAPPLTQTIVTTEEEETYKHNTITITNVKQPTQAPTIVSSDGSIRESATCAFCISQGKSIIAKGRAKLPPATTESSLRAEAWASLLGFQHLQKLCKLACIEEKKSPSINGNRQFKSNATTQQTVIRNTKCIKA
jgi:hypothetical protein